MKRLCTICARGGSKGVKNKNLAIIKGVPLIGHSIIQAQKSSLFDDIAVSSDSDQILEIATQFGVNLAIKRPAEMALDSSPKLPSIVHAAKYSEEVFSKKYDLFCDLDATSPLRNIDDIIESVRALERQGHGNLITASRSRRSPYFNLIEFGLDGRINVSKPGASNFIRRQDVPNTYDMNASIYLWTRASLFSSNSIFSTDTLLYEMPEERSLDIDSEFDFEIVKFLMERSDS